MELTYRNENGYEIPNLAFRAKPPVTLGKYAYIRKRYLKQHRKVLYINLLTSDKLNEHLWDIEQTALERLETIVSAMVKSEGITERLKRKDPMLWVQKMNSIRSRAEETILSELIYA